MRTGQSSASSESSSGGREYRWHPRAKQPARPGLHVPCRNCRDRQNYAPSPGAGALATNPGSSRRSAAKPRPYTHQFLPDRMDHAEHAEHSGSGTLLPRHESMNRREQQPYTRSHDIFRDPVTGKRGAETAEHVVAGEPPAANIKEHRRNRIGDVQVVVYPEKFPLAFFPLDRELCITKESTEGLRTCGRHRTSSLKQIRNRISGDLQGYITLKKV